MEMSNRRMGRCLGRVERGKVEGESEVGEGEKRQSVQRDVIDEER
jgi:hypothetical protein